MSKDEISRAKKVFKQAWESLDDIFDEKRSDTIMEKAHKKAAREEVAMCKFKKGLIGKTNQINFRILIGYEKTPGDNIYEAVYMDDKKEPYIYHYMIDPKSTRDINNILKGFKDPDWNGYKKVKKFKSLTKFLEYAYEKGVYVNKKKEKKEDALNKLIKGLKRSLEAIGDNVKETFGEEHPMAVKIAKVVAVAAVTTIVSAALTPAAGVILSEVAGGGGVGGNVLGEAAQAAGEGLKSLADPANIAKKVAKKAITKGKSFKD
ncbi:MAG: hypothetical protein ACTSR8_16245 [Promethearchaeota archaeon]